MNDKNTIILHPQISYDIIGAAMCVHSERGPGRDEGIYHCALLHALKQQGLKASTKLRGVLKSRKWVADKFELDILVEDTIILELKHIRKPFAPSHYCQLINYLKFWKKDPGILINFGLERLKYDRIPFRPVEASVTCDELWNQYLAKNIPEIPARFTLHFLPS